jgi:hypothetical protein
MPLGGTSRPGDVHVGSYFFAFCVEKLTGDLSSIRGILVATIILYGEISSGT